MKAEKNPPGKPVCYIFGAGDCPALPCRPGPKDLVIAADGGYRAVERFGLTAHWVVGDFDSLGYVPVLPNVVRAPREKDDTDLALAIRLGCEQGYQRFYLFGVLGGRLDMTVASLQLLGALSKQRLEVFLFQGDGTLATAVTDGALRFSAGCRGTFSVFCHGAEAVGVEERGVYFPLTDARLTCDVPLGVSNEWIGQEAVIAVQSGTLLVLWHGGPEDVSHG